MVLTNYLKSSTPRRTPRGSASKLKKVKDLPKCNIKVVVRCRPPNENELGNNHHNVIKFIDDQNLIFDPSVDQEEFFYHGVRQTSRDITKRLNKNMNFAFDYVFNHSSTNNDIYETSVKNILDSLMDGINCSVFAYGATGAGKTFTMLGNEMSPGISYLTMVGLFNRMKEYENRSFKLAITYVEVYNENVQDLLRPSGQLHLREVACGNVILSGVSIHEITSAEELIAMLKRGNLNRTQHPTDANSQSSRSHAVFQIHMHMKNNTSGIMQQMKLSMIDLAGSERASATSGVGLRFKEGANINKSLLALGNCINSLADGHNHIPYRNSKLTRLLKDSLGGNCKTVMIANISPSSLSFEDTYNTLKYATRAKSIQTRTSSNVIHQRKDLAYYVDRVKCLELEIEVLKKKSQTVNANPVRKQIMFESPAMPILGWNVISKQFTEYFDAQKTLLQVQSEKQLLECRVQIENDYCSAVKDLHPDNLKVTDRTILDLNTQFDYQISALSSRLSLLWDNHNKLYTNLQEIICKHNSSKLKNTLENEVLKLNNNALIVQSEHMQKVLFFVNHTRKNVLNALFSLVEKILRQKFSEDNNLIMKCMEEDIKSVLQNLQQQFKSVSWDDKIDCATVMKLSSLSLVQEIPLLNSTITLSTNDSMSDDNFQENKQTSVLDRFHAQTVDKLCRVNNVLCDNINIACLSDVKPNSESTFLIPAKLVPAKSVNTSRSLSQKPQQNVFRIPTNKVGVAEKNQGKLFKSPRVNHLTSRTENKENVVSKVCNKGKSDAKVKGTMGTAPRFPPQTNSTAKLKQTPTTLKTAKK